MNHKYTTLFLVLIDGNYYALNEADKDVRATNSKNGIDIISTVKIPQKYFKDITKTSRYNN